MENHSIQPKQNSSFRYHIRSPNTFYIIFRYIHKNTDFKTPPQTYQHTKSNRTENQHHLLNRSTAPINPNQPTWRFRLVPSFRKYTQIPHAINNKLNHLARREPSSRINEPPSTFHPHTSHTNLLSSPLSCPIS